MRQPAMRADVWAPPCLPAACPQIVWILFSMVSGSIYFQVGGWVRHWRDVGMGWWVSIQWGGMGRAGCGAGGNTGLRSASSLPHPTLPLPAHTAAQPPTDPQEYKTLTALSGTMFGVGVVVELVGVWILTGGQQPGMAAQVLI